jgi:hypothetical protein
LSGTSHALDADQTERVDSLKAGAGMHRACREANYVHLRQPVECCIDPLGRDVIKGLEQLLTRKRSDAAGQLEHYSRFSRRVSRIIGHGEALSRIGEPV